MTMRLLEDLRMCLNKESLSLRYDGELLLLSETKSFALTADERLRGFPLLPHLLRLVLSKTVILSRILDFCIEIVP